MGYPLNVLIAFDQLGNALLNGSPDETLSARAYRSNLYGRWAGRMFRPLIDAIFFFDPSHCQKAYIAEQKRRQLPPEYR